jgi:hypothetical protein
MFKRAGFAAVVGLALVLSAVGAKEAFASGTRAAANCPEPGNWCATVLGGDLNCNACCELHEYAFGICSGYEEEETQRCLCSA